MGFISILLILISAALPNLSNSQPFKCSEGSTCQALVGYITPNTTTLSHIKTLFGVKHLRSILGANNLPLTTPPNHIIKEQQTIKIPLPCICYNGTGVSNRMPIYTVQKDDGLYHIASDVYSYLLTFHQIAAANKVPNPNLILIGEKLWIPLPCGCDEVEGERVVHYGLVVAEGSTVEGIAKEFGTSNETLLKLNGIANDSELIAYQAFDVPLKGLSSQPLLEMYLVLCS